MNAAQKSSSFFRKEKTVDRRNFYLFGIKILSLKLRRRHNFTRWLDGIRKKNPDQIAFISAPNFWDNPLYLYEYIKQHDPTKRLVWFVTNRNLEDRAKGIYHLRSAEGIKQLQQSKYIVSNHIGEYLDFLNSDEHIIINLWHGMPIKVIGINEKTLDIVSKQRWDYVIRNSRMFATSDIFKNLISASTGVPYNHIYVTGQARNDSIFSKKHDEAVEKLLNISSYRYVILYSPTWKERPGYAEREIYKAFNNLFYMDDYNEQEFIDYLEKENILFIVKPHPQEEDFYTAQSEHMALFKSRNVRLLTNRMLFDAGIYLYEIFKFMDIMISDLSSIAIDYLITGKKVIYVDNLTEEISDKRGVLLPDNYRLLQIGNAVNTYQELLAEIKKSLSGAPPLINTNQLALLHRYTDANSCQRIYEIMKSLD